jgi:ATP/ADP translocase
MNILGYILISVVLSCVLIWVFHHYIVPKNLKPSQKKKKEKFDWLELIKSLPMNTRDLDTVS